MNRRQVIGSSVVMLALIAAAGALMGWKYFAVQSANAAAMSMPEPVEFAESAVATAREHRSVTTSIGTVLALRSITLRNELAGMVREANLTPGQVVEEGTVLVALDVAVEEAELRAQEAQAKLAQMVLERMEDASLKDGASDIEVDRATAERDIARANIERIKAIIARKTIVAPFRARIGMSDLHIGQYLEEGTELTTLQGVDDAVHVDFTVAQQVAAALTAGDEVQVVSPVLGGAVTAEVVAIDARVDIATRNAWIRAKVIGAGERLSPGASVRVQVPVGQPRKAVAVPVSAVRKGPEGDHVFVLQPDDKGQMRAHMRQVVSSSMLGDEILVVDGLTPGETVAAAGSFKLREGVLVVPPSANGGQGQGH